MILMAASDFDVSRQLDVDSSQENSLVEIVS